MELLQAPFEATEIEWRVGSTTADKAKGLALAYVTNRAIQNRLDDTFGCFGWKNEFKEWKNTSQICGISVWNEEQKEWITKWDGSDDSATEAVKGGLSDSMKRCGYQWGIGRYLYNLPQIWVPLKNKKYLAETPKLPAWALPKGLKKEPIEPKVTDPIITTEPETIKDDPIVTVGILNEKQIARLYAIAHSAGYDHPTVLKHIAGKYNLTSTTELTKVQYDVMCKGYQAKKDSEK